MSGGKRSAVQIIDREEPSFIKKFKQRVGYVEPCSVEDKLATDERRIDNDNQDTLDDAPTIALIPGKSKGVTEEDVKKIQDKFASDLREKKATKVDVEDSQVTLSEKNDSGKYKFEAPSADKLTASSGHTSSKEKKRLESLESLKNTSKIDSAGNLKVSNPSLLSFGDEEEEDES